jgi:hypothetical protein
MQETNFHRDGTRDYIPGSMGFAEGMLMGPLQPQNPAGFMLADEKKARAMIRKLKKEGRKITSAEMGLDGDWRENSCEIFDGKKFHAYDAFEGSGWATPILIVHFQDGPSEAYDVYKIEVKES